MCPPSCGLATLGRWWDKQVSRWTPRLSALRPWWVITFTKVFLACLRRSGASRKWRRGGANCHRRRPLSFVCFIRDRWCLSHLSFDVYLRKVGACSCLCPGHKLYNVHDRRIRKKLVSKQCKQCLSHSLPSSILKKSTLSAWKAAHSSAIIFNRHKKWIAVGIRMDV